MPRLFFTYILALSLVYLSACSKNNEQNEPEKQDKTKTIDQVSPLFKYSITSNDIDFIKDGDSDAFESFIYLKQERKEMPGANTNELFDEKAYIFKASFSNQKELEIWCHSSFISKDKAEEYVAKLCPRLGKLPEIQRDMLNHVVIHTGNRTAFAETEGRFFVLYSENMDTRIRNNDLEETVFHESVHASLQDIYENTSEWKTAQEKDKNYITSYAMEKPSLEDMPESALFCYTLIKYPGRLSTEIENWVKEYIPNRLEFFKTIYQ